MSGHSKWHNIRVKKTAADAKRGKIFTRHAKLIEIAAQRGGDPDTNPSLRTAIDNAKADSVPNANIDRAIKKGSGELKGDRMEEIVYAAYLPVRSSEGAEAGGSVSIAMIIECLTDNKNRTLSNVRMILSKNGAHFAESGSVLWMFERRGVVAARNEALTRLRQGFAGQEMENGKLSEDVELELIDAGAADIETDDDTVTVTTNAADWPKVRDLLKQKGFEIESAGLKYVPAQKAAITDAETVRKLLAVIDAVEEDDDVSEVHTNADISAEVAGQL